MAGGASDDDGEIVGINATPRVDIMLGLLIISMAPTSTSTNPAGMGIAHP